MSTKTDERIQNDEEEELEDEDPDLYRCNICRSDHGDDDNPLVLCDKCSVCVHRECYGNPLSVKIPDDEWFCDRCQHDALNECCALCPSTTGAMKRTTDWRWAHLSCAMWIPETFFRVPDGHEPIDILQIPQFRFNNVCCHCKSRSGATMICGHTGCNRNFHITCGLQHDIFLEYKSNNKGADIIVALCYEHSKKWYAKQTNKKK